MTTPKPSSSLVDFYRQQQFNPVPIAVEDGDKWRIHVQRRRNLYENHLGIPLSLLEGKSVVEFGCNSGENALVLALFGARLTLVEPNQTVWPRLRQLFDRFNLADRIISLTDQEVGQFDGSQRYDVVIAEGFVNTLPDRDAIVTRLIQLARPGGLVLISFDDRYGCLLECLKQLAHYRCCELEGIRDRYSEPSLQLAERLFSDSYGRLNASRPFKAWVQDSLVNPWLSADILWSFPQLIPLIERAGGAARATSPVWSDHTHFQWYKNTPDIAVRHARLLQAWKQWGFIYSLCGQPAVLAPMPGDKVIEYCAAVVGAMSDYVLGRSGLDSLPDAKGLVDYLNQAGQAELAKELAGMLRALRAKGSSTDSVISLWQQSEVLNRTWGCPYHYISFSNERAE